MGNRIPQFSVSGEEFIDNLIEKNKELEEENRRLSEKNKIYSNALVQEKEENRRLKDKLNAFESSKFNTMALLEIQHPKTAREAENLLQVKKVFERLYNDRLYCLEEENKKLNEKVRFLEECLDRKEEVNQSLRGKNRKLSEGKIIYASEKEQRHYVDILEENQKIKEENKNLNKDKDKWKYLYFEEVAKCDKLKAELNKLKQ